MSPPKSDMQISRIDREKHTVYMTVNGCPVTAICSPESDPDIYYNIKNILVNSVSKNLQKSRKNT